MKIKVILLTSVMSSFAAWAGYQAPEKIDGDYSRLIIYRPYQWQGSVWANPYCVDGQKVAELRTDSYTWLKVTAGAHRVAFCRGGENATLTINVNFVAGTDYFLREGPAAKDLNQHVLEAEQAKAISETRSGVSAGVTVQVTLGTTFALVQQEFAVEEMQKFKFKEPLIQSVDARKE
jgi:hypothetical protein